MLERLLTPAEQVLMRGVEAGDVPSSLARARALTAFGRVGLPSRKQENWHYTDLRVLLRNIPEEINIPSTSGLRSPLLENCPTFGLINGRALCQDLPDFIQSLRPQFEAAAEEMLPKWHENDIIAQINTAYAGDGFSVNLTQDCCLEIQNIVEGGQAHIHLPICVDEAKRVMIVSREMGGLNPSFSTTLTSLDLRGRAEVVFVILRQHGEESCELNQFNAHLAEGAKLSLFIVNAGGKLIRQEVNVDMAGKGSDFQLRGINLLNGRSHTDVTMDVQHREENSTSTEIVRNVVMGRARGVFQGMIRVAQQAQKTDARMACNSLILSDEAEFDAKPELEIFADDVACGHGATVVDINQDHLFYLMARGIPEAQARMLLIKAFVDELMTEIENEDLQNAVKDVIERWLNENIH